MKKAELILGVLSAASIVLNMMLIPGSVVLMMLSLTFLSMLYLYFGIALFNGIRLRNIAKKESYVSVSNYGKAGSVAAGFSLSIMLIGIMFKFLSWPGADLNLAIGVITLSLVATVAVFKFSRTGNEYYKRILTRVFIVGTVGLLIFSLPRHTLIEIKYRNYPSYLEVLKLSNENPMDEELLKRADDEREKMYLMQDKNKTEPEK